MTWHSYVEMFIQYNVSMLWDQQDNKLPNNFRDYYLDGFDYFWVLNILRLYK